MAQTVKTPRFWINEIAFLMFNNYGTMDDSVFNTLPVIPKTRTAQWDIQLPYDLNDKGFIAILGHKGLNVISGINYKDGGKQINANIGDSYNGWSLAEIDISTNQFQFGTNENAEIGSIVIGSYFDVPYSPDLNLTMTHDYSGIKKTTTRGGSTLINAQYHKNPKWGDYGAWEIDRGNNDSNLARSGRRSWDLSFSYFSDSDVYPESLNLTNMNDEIGNIDGGLNTGSDDFFGNVIHRTAGGGIPFIFSPDSTSSSLDNFYICMFDQDKFSFSQISPTLYTTKLRIVEAW